MNEMTFNLFRIKCFSIFLQLPIMQIYFPSPPWPSPLFTPPPFDLRVIILQVVPPQKFTSFTVSTTAAHAQPFRTSHFPLS